MTYFLLWILGIVVACVAHYYIVPLKDEHQQMLEDEEQAEYLRNLK